MPTLHCDTCNKEIYRQPCKAAKYEKNFCNVICQAGNTTSWIGFLLDNYKTMSRRQMAEHIGIPLNTLRSWIFRINRMGGVHIPYENKCRPKKEKTKKVKKEKPPKVIKVKTPKEVKVKVVKPKSEPKNRSTMRRPTKPEIKIMPTKNVDFTRKKSVRVSSKTTVLADINEPDEVVIARYYEKYGSTR